jgi:hypothetical protein
MWPKPFRLQTRLFASKPRAKALLSLPSVPRPRAATPGPGDAARSLRSSVSCPKLLPAPRRQPPAMPSKKTKKGAPVLGDDEAKGACKLLPPSLPSFSPGALPYSFSCSSFARVRLQKVVLRTGTVPIARGQRTVRSSLVRTVPHRFFVGVLARFVL